MYWSTLPNVLLYSSPTYWHLDGALRNRRVSIQRWDLRLLNNHAFKARTGYCIRFYITCICYLLFCSGKGPCGELSSYRNSLANIKFFPLRPHCFYKIMRICSKKGDNDQFNSMEFVVNQGQEDDDRPREVIIMSVAGCDARRSRDIVPWVPRHQDCLLAYSLLEDDFLTEMHKGERPNHGCTEKRGWKQNYFIFYLLAQGKSIIFATAFALVAKLVDAPGLGSGDFGSVGSSPIRRTPVNDNCLHTR